MSIQWFVNGRGVNLRTPGEHASSELLATQHGEDFVRSFATAMFRRLNLDQQAAVVTAWEEAYSRQAHERVKKFELLVSDVLEKAS